MGNAARNQIITTLYDCYKANGFITEDEALSLFAANNISLANIDALTEQLLLRGVIIKTEADVGDDEEEYDRGQTDFECLYKNVVDVEPSLHDYVEYVRQIQPPQHREWRILMPQYKSGNKYAKNRLHNMYLRSVIKIAYSFHKRFGALLADTIQDGNIGLLYALRKFNIAEHGVFPSYYPMWVMQNITRYMSFSPNPLLYFPVHMKDKLNKLYDNVVDAGGIGKADLSSITLFQSVIGEMDCTEDEAKYYLSFFQPLFSIEEQLEKQEISFTDCGIQAEDMMDAVDKILLHHTVKDVLTQLKSRESKVLELRHGLLDNYERTLEEVGEHFGVTRERIRQIEAKAIRRLRHPTRSKKLRPFFDAPIYYKPKSKKDS